MTADRAANLRAAMRVVEMALPSEPQTTDLAHILGHSGFILHDEEYTVTMIHQEDVNGGATIYSDITRDDGKAFSGLQNGPVTVLYCSDIPGEEERLSYSFATLREALLDIAEELDGTLSEQE
jgi:hypothetical protein